MIIVLGVLTAVGIIAALVDTSLLWPKPPTVRVAMLLILVMAVVSVAAVIDGTACRCWKNGHPRPGFVPDNCDRYSCQTVTDGIPETAGFGISAS